MHINIYSHVKVGYKLKLKNYIKITNLRCISAYALEDVILEISSSNAHIS